MSSKLIYVEGIIGAGKSTFVQNLSKHMSKLTSVQEPVDEWQKDGILEKYYKDMRRWALSFQLRIVHDKIKLLNSLEFDNDNIYVVERSIYSDKCFTNTLNHFDILDDFDYKLSTDVRDIYEEYTKKSPDLIIYLRPTIKKCMNRVKKRNRKEEKDLTVEYQEVLLRYHDTLFNSDKLTILNGTDVPVLILEDNDITDEVLEKIQSMLS